MEPEVPVHHAESLIIAHRDLSVRSRSYRSTRRIKMLMASSMVGFQRLCKRVYAVLAGSLHKAATHSYLYVSTLAKLYLTRRNLKPLKKPHWHDVMSI